MSNHKDQTAPTQFIEANGIRFAYRRFGKIQVVPLVFNNHILGNPDSWDSAVTDGLAQGRKVILFNNAGIASLSGEVPCTFAEMATNAIAFIDALGLKKVDVLGVLDRLDDRSEPVTVCSFNFRTSSLGTPKCSWISEEQDRLRPVARPERVSALIFNFYLVPPTARSRSRAL